jgi:cytochrome bd-type quinol oxidase subunit 1
MDFDPLFLSRLQFACVIAFHFLLPAFTIGLAVTQFLTGGDVIASLLAYTVVYSLVFGAGAYYLVRLVRRGFPAAVDPHEPKLAERPPGEPSRLPRDT